MLSTNLLSLVQGVRKIHHEAEPNLWVRRMFYFLQIHAIQYEHLELFLLDMHESDRAESNRDIIEQEQKKFSNLKLTTDGSMNNWFGYTYT